MVNKEGGGREGGCAGVKNKYIPHNRYCTSSRPWREITWYYYKLTRMIKIEPKDFMIVSFLCFRIHYHLFESYWVVLSKYQNVMVSLPFVFCLSKHIFLMIIQIFTERHFSLVFGPLISWTRLIPHFLAFWEIYILIIHQWPISISKAPNGPEWGRIMPHCIYFLKLKKNWWHQQMYHMKSGQTHNIRKLQHNSFPMRAYYSSKCYSCNSPRSPLMRAEIQIFFKKG